MEAGNRPIARVVVESLAAGGDGVGRLGGKAVFVPFTAAGDLVEIAVVEERRTFVRARALRVLTPSPDRLPAPCPVFGQCGGCAWQHLAYPAQLSAKRSIVEEALRRIGRLDRAPVAAAVPSPREYGYRHRARLHAARGGGATRFGFFRRVSHEVVAIGACPVLHPSLNVALGALAAVGGGHAGAFAGWAEVRLDTGWDGSAVRVAPRGPDREPLAVRGPDERRLLAAVGAGGPRLLLGEESGSPLALGPGDDALVTTGETFTQVNLSQNPRLVAAALALAAVVPGESALDLYCGLGNLALPAAARGARVLGADLDGEAVRQAGENAARLGLDAAFTRGDAAAVARELAAGGRRFDLVLLNPPRTGAREALPAVAALRPRRVVAVSCDPATLARDAAGLAAAGYLLVDAVPIDLFPQTAHVETVALFTRGGVSPAPGGV